MPSPWNEGTDRQLLLIIIALSAPSLPKWDLVAQHMGEGFTAESTRQHFQKLRKETKTKYSDLGEPNGDKKTPSTPAKEKGKAKGTPGSKKRKMVPTSDNEDDEEELKVKKEEDQESDPELI